MNTLEELVSSGAPQLVEVLESHNSGRLSNVPFQSKSNTWWLCKCGDGTPLSEADGSWRERHQAQAVLNWLRDQLVPEELRIKYSLELGVDDEAGQRVCVAEVGPFLSESFAVNRAHELRGKLAAEVLAQQDASDYDGEQRHNELPIVGCTVNAHNDKYGTISERDLY